LPALDRDPEISRDLTAPGHPDTEPVAERQLVQHEIRACDLGVHGAGLDHRRPA
jgi:hypothetical protein